MKLSIIAGLIGLTSLAAAAPADHIRRPNDIGHRVRAPGYGSYPYPTGFYPTGTLAAMPIPTGRSSCPVDGAVLCNGPALFGLCDHGTVVWQRVSDGTACRDGKIVGTGYYGTPMATGTS